MIGKTISHYKILEKLGEGGMGVVYRAEDTKLGRPVALKFLSSVGSVSTDDQARFLREAKAAAALDHPNICPVHEIGEAEGQAFIAMACVEGVTLKDRIASGPIALSEILDIASQIADGLAEAHEKGIVHRDIKPANLMVTPEGRIKIMDFGLAKLAAATRLTRPGATVGTISYMSPEQTRAEDVDHRADIWSLGVVLYEMVTGQRPFGGVDSQAIAYSILNDKPPPLTSLRPDAPEEIERLVSCCLAKEADERFQTAGEFAAALRGIEVTERDGTLGAVSSDAATIEAGAHPPSDLPREIAGYRILERLGEGGMGMVYLAEQQKPVRRRVALKVIKLGMDTKEVIARFESERQALAMMSHPNIARIFDAGATQEGRPYFAMEYVPGETITEYCDKHRLSIKERLDLFIDVCRAIHHAHQKAIIHRDIKPSNILVMIQDEKPVPKVIDFGVAKATTQRLTERTVFTEFGELVGTPEYMSPEQLEMTGLDVDTTTDVYSLGVLLYELLVGALPFEPKTLREAGWDGIRRLIREVDPPRPSTRIGEAADRAAETAARRQTESDTLRKLVRGELDWITMRALEKDRTRRYQSASEFAADIERHLSDEPVLASPPSTTYRVGKFIRRHRGPFAAAVVVAATIVTMGSVALWQARVAQRSAIEARANAILAYAEGTEDPLLKALLVLELPESPELPGRLTVAREAADHPLPTAAFQAHDGAIWIVAVSPDGSRFSTGGVDGVVKIWRWDGTGEPIVLRRHEGDIWNGEFSPDGEHIITISADSTALIWRTDGLGEPVVLRGHRGGVRGVAVSPDGTLVATASGDSTVRVWRADGRGEAVVLRHDGLPVFVDFSPDGTRLATSCHDSLGRIWPTDGLGEPLVLRGHSSDVVDVDFSPDGTRVVTASWDSTARIWPSDGSGDPVVLKHESSISLATFGPEGSLVVTDSGGATGNVHIWRADGEGGPTILPSYHGWLNTIEISPDGTRIATAGHDGTARIWGIDGSAEPTVLCRQDAEVMGAYFSPDGSRVVTNSGDGSVRVWRTDDTGEPVVFNAEAVWASQFSPDGSRVVTGSYGGTVQVWAADGTGEPLTIGRHRGAVRSVSFSPDGTRVATASFDSTGGIWRADGGGEVAILRGHEGRLSGVSFSPDGTQVATAARDGRVVVWPADGNGEPIVLADFDDRTHDAVFTPDGHHVIAAVEDGKARMWPADGTGEPKVVAEHKTLQGLGLSPDGLRLATISFDGTARIWDLDGAEPPIVLRGHSNRLYAVDFSPDGDYVATSSMDNTVRVWRADSGTEVLVLDSRGDDVPWDVAFHPDGTRLLVGYLDGARMLRITWQGLKEYLRREARGCLTPEQRMRFLGESSSRAWKAYAECERRQGRTPAIRKPE